MAIPKLLRVSLLLCAFGVGTYAFSAVAPVIPALTSPATGKHTPGRFVWVDLFSSDPAASSRFYRDLFGWQEKVMAADGKTYRILSASGRSVGGIVQGPPRVENQAAARWIGYVSVTDMERAVAHATSHGGRIVIEPRNVPDRGMHAIVADPDGAFFGLITSSTGDPEDYLAEVNEWMWASLFTRDTRKILPFYRAIAGWDEFEDYRTAPEDDFIVSSGGFARAAISPLPAGVEAATANWVGFVRVSDVSATARKARALGARVVVEPRTIQAGNDVAILIDPLGAVIGVAAFFEDSTKQP